MRSDLASHISPLIKNSATFTIPDLQYASNVSGVEIFFQDKIKSYYENRKIHQSMLFL